MKVSISGEQHIPMYSNGPLVPVHKEFLQHISTLIYQAQFMEIEPGAEKFCPLWVGRDRHWSTAMSRDVFLAIEAYLKEECRK